MQTLLQDLRYGARLLLKRPGFTFVAVITLALGIGANSAIFSVVNAVLLRPLPFNQADRLVMVWDNFLVLGMEQIGAKPAEYIDYQQQNNSFDDVAAFNSASLNLTGEHPQRLSVARVTANLFPLLGASALNGRVFSPDDNQPGNDNVVLLSHALWQNNFGADTGIIGKSMLIEGRSYTVIGVMPSDFQFPHASFSFTEPADLWLPLAFTKEEIVQRQGQHNLNIIARLKSNVSLDQARADMSAIAARLEQEQPGYRGPNGEDGGWRITVVGLQEQVAGRSRPALLVMLGLVGLVLAVACANVANLLLGRASARQKEIAIRSAIGASRRRLIRQLLTESLMLALPAGALGLLMALWGIDLLPAIAPANLPRLAEINLDWHVLLFTLALALMTGIVFGLAPALQSSKPDLNQTLKEGAGKACLRAPRAANLLVTFEVALALFVLVCAGLMIRSFARLQQIDPGLDPRNVLTVELSLPAAKYTAPAQSAAFYEQLITKVEALPGVSAAATGLLLPLGGFALDDPFSIEGRPLDMSNPTVAGHQSVSPGYFSTLGMTMRRGRDFTADDSAAALPVAIINQAMARAYWPGEDPLGKHIKLGAPRAGGDWRTVVGIVGDIPHRGIDSNARPDWYAPATQSPSRDMFLVVRSSVDAASLADEIREQVMALDRDQPVTSIRTLDEVIASSVAPRKFNTLLAGLFAVIALLLAGVGIYSVLLQSVNARIREIGIRMALGAQARDVSRLVIRQGMTYTLLGVAMGLVAACLFARLLQGLLYKVSATDPLTFAGVAVLLTLIALLACYIPARRAAKVDPMTALRYE